MAEVYQPERATDAHRRLEARVTRGRLVIHFQTNSDRLIHRDVGSEAGGCRVSALSIRQAGGAEADSSGGRDLVAEAALAIFRR
jgi:hypothetical protein